MFAISPVPRSFTPMYILLVGSIAAGLCSVMLCVLLVTLAAPVAPTRPPLAQTAAQTVEPVGLALPFPASAKAQSAAAAVPQDWWAGVQSSLHQQMLQIQPDEHGDAYTALNPQGFQAAFADGGVQLRPWERGPLARSAPASLPAEDLQADDILLPANTPAPANWDFSLLFSGLSAGGQWLATEGAPQFTASGQQGEYRHILDSSGDIAGLSVTEWFVNGERGLEQGFVIQPLDNLPKLSCVSPQEDNLLNCPTEEIRLGLAVGGDLAPSLVGDGQVIELRDARGVLALTYSELHAFDATGRALPARLAAADGQIQIVVDATGAVYPLVIDPLVSTAPLSPQGPAPVGNYLGYSVSTAGDVNGDGYSDVIVGARGSNSNQGRAYLYLGTGSGLGATPALTLSGEAASNNFGNSVSTAGDINGDGYSDVLVGAYGYNSNRGRVYLYLGGPAGLSATPVQTYTGETTGNFFGSSLSTAGDFSGDGNADIIVGAPGYNSNQGRAYVYLGSSSTLTTTPAVIFTGEAVGDQFGYSVATAGDVNGDGYADVVVGAPSYNSNQGRFYLFLGSAGVPALTVTGEAASRLGWSVSTAGDVNGDGYSDVIAGAFSYNSSQGRAYVYLGSDSGLAGTPALTLTGEAGTSQFGVAVATAGDVNGDGYADWIVGASAYNSQQGRAYVYLGAPDAPGGGSGLTGTPALTLTGEAGTSQFGFAVATAGDVNGDGYADIVIGAWAYNAYQGKIYLTLGSPGSLSASAAPVYTGQATSNNFGYSVASAGDVNGDGYADAIVGAYSYNSSQGRAYLYMGASGGLAGTPALTLTGEAGSAFGQSVASAGDVNGDGYADVVIGAYGYNVGRGRAYLYMGSGSGLGATPALTLTGEAGSAFGVSVARAGDVNGDGYADVIIGARDYNTFQGLVYLYLGSGSGLSATPILTLTGEAINNSFGLSVATAGDVNGDGNADWLVGARGNNGDRGRAYLYLGSGSVLSSTPALTLTGEAAAIHFGTSVATAGDVNGDGYADVVIGADLYNSNRGRAYLYKGSGSGLSATPALTLTGEASGIHFGVSVATAGDVNGDGYADWLVGAYQYLTSTGRAYLYMGSGGSLSTTPALTLTGEITQTGFGSSVSTAGDVNGDGYAEVIVGAYQYNSQQGRAYVYSGNESLGVSLKPQARRADNSAPINYLGKSDDDTSFRLAALGRIPFGRGLVKLEWEVKPLGTLFDGTPNGQTLTWMDTGTAGAALNNLVTKLEAGDPTSGTAINHLVAGLTPNTPYHWRLRLIYHPAVTPFAQYSRWFTQPWVGSNETRLRTANTPTAVTLASFTAASAGSGAQVSWEAASEVGVLGYNLWRSQTPGDGYMRLNPNMIPAQGGQGSRYSYFDATATPGQASYYRLEVVNLDGSSEWAGAVAVMLPRAVLFLPWAGR